MGSLAEFRVENGPVVMSRRKEARGWAGTGSDSLKSTEAVVTPRERDTATVITLITITIIIIDFIR